MKLIIDTNDERLSPAQRLTLQNLANHLANNPPTRKPPCPATVQSCDEALGKRQL
jgi:hypothetical protein